MLPNLLQSPSGNAFNQNAIQKAPTSLPSINFGTTPAPSAKNSFGGQWKPDPGINWNAISFGQKAKTPSTDAPSYSAPDSMLQPATQQTDAIQVGQTPTQGGSDNSSQIPTANPNESMQEIKTGAAGTPVGGGLYGSLISQLSGMATTPDPNITNAANQISNLRTQAAIAEGTYGGQGMLPVALGRAQTIANTEAQQEQGIQAGLQNLLTARGQNINALGAATTAAAPVQVPYGTQFISPANGQSVLPGGGAGGDLNSSLTYYAQQLASGQMTMDQVPSTISGNAVLAAQLQQQAQQFNPQYNPIQSSANASAQQQALSQNVTQGRQISMQAQSANQALQTLQDFYAKLSPLQTAGIPLTNDFAQTLGAFLGSGTVGQYQTALADARAQLEGVLTSTGATTPTGAQEMAMQYLPDGMTPAQLPAKIAAAQALISQKVEAFNSTGNVPQYGATNTGSTAGQPAGWF